MNNASNPRRPAATAPAPFHTSIRTVSSTNGAGAERIEVVAFSRLEMSWHGDMLRIRGAGSQMVVAE